MDNLDWHERFTVQAGWTKELRHFLYQQIGLNKSSRVLEVGCGTGVITSELNQINQNQTSGIDIQFERLEIARQQEPMADYCCANVYGLPYSKNSFDYVASHYVFLWLKDPLKALSEIKRVLKPGGQVIALAEPDYLARIDNPQPLWELGELQTRSLIQQGANPMAGRQLSAQLVQAGFVDVQYGISGFQENACIAPANFESEWKVVENDILSLTSTQKINEFRELELAAVSDGSRIKWVPTFYAFGKKSY